MQTFAQEAKMLDEAIGWFSILLGVLVCLFMAAAFEAVVTRYRKHDDD